MQSLASRLASSAFAALVGLGVAVFAVVRVPRPDVWWWLAIATVLLAAAALIVLFVERIPRLSTWGLMGLAVVIAVGLVPFLWTVTLALDPGASARPSLLPASPDPDRIRRMLTSPEFGELAATSALVAGASALVALVVGVPLAYPLARRTFPGRRALRGLVWALLLLPVVVLVSPAAEGLRLVGRLDTVPGLIVVSLGLTVPFATWALMMLLDRVPWSLWRLATGEGATAPQRFLRLGLPLLGPRLLAVFAGSFLLVWNDLIAVAGVAVTQTRTMPLAMREADAVPGIALVSLVWFVPAVIALGVAVRGSGLGKD